MMEADADQLTTGASPGAEQERVSGTDPLSILVVDDDLINRRLVQAMLRREGHEVFMADSGEQAIEVFDAQSPDLVLMDVMMPGIDGYEAARRIKARAGDRFVPLIFLTALTEDEALVSCVEAGGDDFVTKPVNRVILNAKIDAMSRVRKLYATLRSQNSQLAHYHAQLRREHEVAERVFTNIMGADGCNIDNVQCLISPMAIANGDLALTATTPAGRQHVMIGDFTGHGLGAAIGALPVSDVFHAMSEKGLPIEEIVSELNRKLYEKLPTEIFLAACLVELDPASGRLRVWNGGLPDVLLVGSPGEAPKRIASHHLPLGVAGNEALDVSPQVHQLAPGDRVLLCSDGLIEACSPGGEMFGQERYEQHIRANADRATLFDEIKQSLAEFRGDKAQNDDITLLELYYEPAMAEPSNAALHSDAPPEAIPKWTLSVSLGPEVMRTFDPLELLLPLAQRFEGIQAHKTYLYSILGELYSNALEHGVLEIDPALKSSAAGFERFYEERERLLENLQEGWIRISLECVPRAGRDWLRIEVEDSGRGSGPESKPAPITDNEGFNGRGLELIRALCDEVILGERGNRISALYGL